MNVATQASDLPRPVRDGQPDVDAPDDLFRGPGRPQFLDDRQTHHVVELRLSATVLFRPHIAFLCTFRFLPGVPSDLPRDGRGLPPKPQIGLYFHALGCGKMGIAHGDSSV
jgi:hypothetical protein